MFCKLEEALHFDLMNNNSPAATRLAQRFSKRFAASSTEDTKQAALTKFLGIFPHVSDTSINLSFEEIGNAREFIFKTLVSGSSYVSAQYDIETHAQATFLPGVLRHPDFLSWGKGRSAIGHGTFIVDKLLDRNLSITSSCVPLLKYLKIFSPELYSNIASELNAGSLVEGSHITTVPKDNDIDRTIACEPLINLWFQLAIGKFISESLRSVGLNIEKQQNINRRYARMGSTHHSQSTDPFCTIDLASASDCISMQLAQLLLPSDLFQVMKMTRSTQAEVNGEWHTLPMVSTMGNGFTFPLLTLICSALVYAANPSFRNGSNNWNACAVFGDDIIVHRTSFDDTISVLQRSGFIINDSKSYSQGLFRESCGYDCYDGVVITPFYIRSLSTPEEILTALNQVLHWGSRHFFLTKTVDYLLSLLDNNKRNLIPLRFSPGAGIHYPTTLSRPKVVYWEKKTVARMRNIKDPGLQLFTILAFSGSVAQKSSIQFSYVTRECLTKFYIKRVRFPFSWDIDADSVLKPSLGSYSFYDGKELRPFWDLRAYETIRLTETQKKRLCQFLDITLYSESE